MNQINQMDMNTETQTTIIITGNIVVHQGTGPIKKKRQWLSTVGSLASLLSLFK